MDEDNVGEKDCPEEMVQDATASIMELIDANDRFEKAGIEFVAVSCAEPEADGLRREAPRLTSVPEECRSE